MENVDKSIIIVKEYNSGQSWCTRASSSMDELLSDVKDILILEYAKDIVDDTEEERSDILKIPGMNENELHELFRKWGDDIGYEQIVIPTMDTYKRIPR